MKKMLTKIIEKINGTPLAKKQLRELAKDPEGAYR